jgi:hypothetical protein
MRSNQAVNLRCRISRGGFSGERVFRVTCYDGTEHVGAAPTHYCLTGNGNPLGPDVPQKGKPIDGWVEGMLVAEDDRKLTVALPDGITIKIQPDQLRTNTSTPHVLFGS